MSVDNLSVLNTLEERVGRLELTAVSVGAQVASILHKDELALTGRVHSVFSEAINIAFSKGELVSIVDSEIGRGPFNVVVRLPYKTALDRLGIKPGQDVHMSKDSLDIENLRIEINSSPIYTSRHNLSDELLNQVSDIESNISQMTKVVANEGHFQGLAPLLDLDEHKRDQKIQETNDATRNRFKQKNTDFFSTELLTSIDNLVRGIESDDVSAIKMSAGSLVGLGPGLTPAADDFLSGFMLAYFLFTENLRGNLEKVRRHNEMIAAFSNETTFLSAQYLRQAAIGNATELAVSTIEKLLTSQSAQDVERTARSLMSVGATSGTDCAIGIILGSKLAMKVATRK